MFDGGTGLSASRHPMSASSGVRAASKNFQVKSADTIAFRDLVTGFQKSGTIQPLAHCRPGHKSGEGMLVERGIQVMNFEVVGDAYAIASNYLRKTGAIPHTLVTDERLLRIIIRMFQHGEYNRLKLANKAIAEFEARIAA